MKIARLPEAKMIKKLRRFLCLVSIVVLSSGVHADTIVLDFNEAFQGNTFDIFGGGVTAFDVTGFGFGAGDFGFVTNSVLDTVRGHFRDIPTTGVNAASAIPDGFELDVDFVIGDIGTAPTNGDPNYFFMQIGNDFAGVTSLGQAGLGVIRNAAGVLDPFGLGSGAVVGSIWSDNINGLGGVGTALTSGNIDATRHALAGTISHEIGHALSLLHLNKSGSVTPNGLSPLMGTGAIDLPNADRILPREFSISGVNTQTGGAAQFHIAQLVGSVGLRATAATVPEPTTVPVLLAAMGIGWGVRRRRSQKS